MEGTPGGAGPTQDQRAGERTRDRAASVSLVLGIIGFSLFFTVWLGFILSVGALACAMLARGKARDMGARAPGLATGGYVMGLLGILAATAWLVWNVSGATPP